tara:strand:+ start:3933 stop:4172 length:240 start_codon:yes stop_codon:yes gene_type:complete
MIVSCNNATMQQCNRRKNMKEEVSRLDAKIAEAIKEKNKEYVKETGETPSKRKMVNALINAGLKKATTKDIQEYIDTEE